MNRTSPAPSPSLPGLVPRWVQWLSGAIGFGGALLMELSRWWNPQTRLEALTGWLAGREADWLPFLAILVLAPVCLLAAGLRHPSSGHQTRWRQWCGESARSLPGSGGLLLPLLGIFTFSTLISWWAGHSLNGTPPAYHDEYSYLFQAETYLQGRFWLPSPVHHPEWFDQVHVLNEGHFASRYFPGVGFWLAPFVALGNPWLGYHLAQGLAAVLLFLAGRELSTNGTALLAALLFACSPGLLFFSNLLLAHHPALLGLLLFLWMFLRWMRQGGNGILCLSGCGLAYAMLCRPMTAAGFALPFGVLFAWWLLGRMTFSWQPVQSELRTRSDRFRTALLLVFPLLVGFLIVGLSNRSITGSWFLTPYQLYQETYTPRHRYGFNNAVIGARHAGPKVLKHYDEWAENLTPALAARNVLTRTESSLRWTLGIVPLMLGGIVCLLTPNLGDRRWGLLWFSILSLHAVHIPYWFSGIQGWHYVFETAPLWILIFAEGTRRLNETWHARGPQGLCWWWSLMIGTALGVNLFTVPPLWPGRIEQGMAELAFPRLRYHAFRDQIEMLRDHRPAVVFVLPDPADRHMDYVTNQPTLNGPVIVARILNRSELPEAAAEFPGRVPIVFDASRRQMTLLTRPDRP